MGLLNVVVLALVFITAAIIFLGSFGIKQDNQDANKRWQNEGGGTCDCPHSGHSAFIEVRVHCTISSPSL
jgi:hypothetical protein